MILINTLKTALILITSEEIEETQSHGYILTDKWESCRS